MKVYSWFAPFDLGSWCWSRNMLSHFVMPKWWTPTLFVPHYSLLSNLNNSLFKTYLFTFYLSYLLHSRHLRSQPQTHHFLTSFSLKSPDLWWNQVVEPSFRRNLMKWWPKHHLWMQKVDQNWAQSSSQSSSQMNWHWKEKEEIFGQKEKEGETIFTSE